MLRSVKDLERESNVSRYTWRSWIRSGKIAHVRLGRRVLVTDADFRDLIEKSRVAARAK